eukprot:c7288_g1_i1.p1 GENE.c7288_g1_i1~~c7288_g1_i1.p1  ORF type:complete len:286 (+),score=76.85 c7288_g1_i1:37-894(+)
MTRAVYTLFSLSLLIILCLGGPIEPLTNLFNKYHNAYKNSEGPVGTYVGKISIFGDVIIASWTTESSNTANISMSGTLELECDQVEFKYKDGYLFFPRLGSPDDCLTQQLYALSLNLVSAPYDPVSDEIAFYLEYSFIKIEIDLPHESDQKFLEKEKSACHHVALPELIERYFTRFSLLEPSGSYSGTKSLFGKSVTVTTTVNLDSTFNLIVQGSISLSCPNEPYTYANGVISVTHISTAGNCISDVLSRYSVSLKSITYDTTSNSVTVSFRYAFITVDIKLTAN